MNKQTLRFSNGCKLSHSAGSQELANYYRDVCKGKIIVPGMKVRFSNPEITIMEVSKNPKSTLAILTDE